MASYQQFVENIGEGRVVPAYRKLLTDINYCTILFEDIETARTKTEMFYDWLAGERGKIDIERFPIVLNNLKQEVKLGMELYIDLTFKMKDLKDMQTFKESSPQPLTHSDGSTARWGTQQELMFQFQQLITAVEHIVIPDETQPRHQLCTRLHEMGSYCVNSNLRNRAKMYETTKTLYQTLNQNEVLDVLRANHATVRELILSIDPNADLPPIPVPQEVRGETIPRRGSQVTKHTVTGIFILSFILFIIPTGSKLGISVLSLLAILHLYRHYL